MHPEVSQALATERIREMRDEATAARQARLARRTRRARRTVARATAALGRRLPAGAAAGHAR
jgi:hypothetical protein